MQLSVPLTDLTKKQMSNKLQWDDSHENAFRILKQKISLESVLLLPNINKAFAPRTDASGTGLGAFLVLEYDGVKRPVLYASCK